MEIRKFVLFVPLFFVAAACSGSSDLPAPPPDCSDAVGVICTWAGSTEGGGWTSDNLPINQSKLNYPTDVVFDRDYNVYVIDRENHRIRKVVKNGDGQDSFQTILGTGSPADGEPNGADETVNGAPGPSVALHSPTDMVVSASNYGYVVDWRNHKIRRIDLGDLGTHLFGGTGAQWKQGNSNGDGGPIASAVFSFPSKLAYLPNTLEFFLVDQKMHAIRKFKQDGSEIGTPIGTVGVSGYGDGGPNKVPALSKLHFDDSKNISPSGGVAIDANGSLYIADSLNHVLRRVTFSLSADQKSTSPKLIETVAGIPPDSTGKANSGFVDGPAEQAKLNNPTDLAIGADGNVYFADTGNHAVRWYDPIAKTVSTLAGTGTYGFSGDNGPAKSAQLYNPLGIGLDQNQVHIYIADTNNHRVRRIRLH